MSNGCLKHSINVLFVLSLKKEKVKILKLEE